jgi:hypothetical protein
MTEREKHEAIVIAAFDVAHSMFEQAVLAWDFFGDDERKKIIDAAFAESHRVGLAGRAASQMTDTTVTKFCIRASARKRANTWTWGGLHPGSLISPTVAI